MKNKIKTILNSEFITNPELEQDVIERIINVFYEQIGRMYKKYEGEPEILNYNKALDDMSELLNKTNS